MGDIEKLNEWHFADYCLRSVQEKGRAVFNIVRRDRHPQFTFTGILRDRKGNIYEITGDESGNLFDTLIEKHALTVNEDHTHTELIIQSEFIKEEHCDD